MAQIGKMIRGEGAQARKLLLFFFFEGVRPPKPLPICATGYYTVYYIIPPSPCSEFSYYSLN